MTTLSYKLSFLVTPTPHIVIDKNGHITQVNNFENRANHVGKPKGDSGIENDNSIGIEVVGLYFEDNETWEALTEDQIEETAQVISTILVEYGLEIGDVHSHEDVSRKTEGEGQTVYDAVWQKVYQYYTEQSATQNNEKEEETDESE